MGVRLWCLVILLIYSNLYGDTAKFVKYIQPDYISLFVFPLCLLFIGLPITDKEERLKGKYTVMFENCTQHSYKEVRDQYFALISGQRKAGNGLQNARKSNGQNSVFLCVPKSQLASHISGIFWHLSTGCNCFTPALWMWKNMCVD